MSTARSMDCGLPAESSAAGGNEIFFDLLELAGAALLRVDGFEMVAHDVGGDAL